MRTSRSTIPRPTWTTAPCATPVVLGCTDPNFIEFDPSANTYDGSCATPVIDGCTDPAYTEYFPEANTDDGSCATLVEEGCTDSAYLEYDAFANTDDGSCATLIVVGCQEAEACNYDAEANTVGPCDYPVDLYGVDYVDCAGDCLLDGDGDGVCDEAEVPGCTDADGGELLRGGHRRGRFLPLRRVH